jgi:Icc-related predicted phosphoesterase
VRLLLVSDLHYRLRQFDWLMAAAEDSRVAIDVVVIAGDHLDIGSAVPLEAQAIAVSAQLRHLGARIPVLSASGNHDLGSRDSFGEKTARWLAQVSSPGVHVDGDSVLLGDTLFTICPWWDGPIARKSLTEQLRTDARRTKQRWVWIYHSPPTASPLSWNGSREFGDEALTEWLPIFRPDVVLAGHIHQAPFVDGGDWIQQIGPTWLFNAGQQPGPMPSHIVLDLDTSVAEWVSATERRQATFPRPVEVDE